MTASRLTARIRQQEIYEYVTGRPNDSLTMSGVANAVGRSPGAGFGIDMAAVRHRILDEGGDLTNCAYDRAVMGYTFHYLPAGSEQRQAIRGLLSASSQVRTRINNNARHGEYVANNAETKEDRAFGRLMIAMQTATASQLGAIETFMRDVGK